MAALDAGLRVHAFIDAYAAKQWALGSSGSFESAALALDNWMKRGRTLESAMRRVEARSPLNTLQEQQVGLPNEEWRILVVCTLLNMTNGAQVRPMIASLFARAPGPLEFCKWVQDEGLGAVETLLKPLGFNKRRARSLVAMSDTFVTKGLPPEAMNNSSWAADLPGIGPYALDSLDIFRYGRLHAPTSDTWLNKYVKWRIDHADSQRIA